MSKYEPHAYEPIKESVHYPDEEIDLRELFATLWSGKWIIILVSLIFALGGVAYALYKPNIYQASVLLASANEESNVGGIGGQLGGLASLAGISLGSGGGSQALLAKEVLQSRAFLTSFIKRHNLEVPLMATIGWDNASGSWIYDREVFNPESDQWLENEEGKSQRPSDWDLVKTLKENHLSLSENKDNGMVTLSIKSQSPPVAQQWAEWLVADINEHMRREDVAEAEARIDYLEAKLKDTTIAGMQQVFYQLIESETRTVMLANAQQEYVFKTIDPAVVPQEKIEPKRALLVIVAVMMGGMLGVFIVFVRAFLKGKSD